MFSDFGSSELVERQFRGISPVVWKAAACPSV
jgi:hypothetical protein